MPYEIFLAIRYLRSRHKRRLVRVTAAAAILGISTGVAALIVAFALSNGFRDEMRDKILQGTAHLSVLRADGLPIPDQVSLAARIHQVDGVVSAVATTYDGAVATGPRGTAYAVLRGTEREVWQSGHFDQWLREGSFAPLFDRHEGSEPSAVLGAELATRIGLAVGDVFQVIPATAGGTLTKSTRRLRVAGIFRSGLFEYDSTWIYISLDTATTFANGAHAASVISVQVRDVDRVKQTTERIRRALGDAYTTVDWQQANQPLFTALALERRMGLFIIGLIIAIAALNITTTLILVVVERRRDIAILNALGATRKGIMALFVIEGALIGATGAVFGVLLGLVACLIGNHYKLVSLPADVYSISGVPFNAKAGEVALAALIAFSLSVLATLYPARAAAHMRPVETLRDAG
jgi:lipoprotein-releasing system permease protein